MDQNQIDSKKMGLSGRMGGMAVKNMLQEVEERIAAGETVSAAPSTMEEAERLHMVRQENNESAQRAQDKA